MSAAEGWEAAEQAAWDRGDWPRGGEGNLDAYDAVCEQEARDREQQDTSRGAQWHFTHERQESRDPTWPFTAAGRWVQVVPERAPYRAAAKHEPASPSVVEAEMRDAGEQSLEDRAQRLAVFMCAQEWAEHALKQALRRERELVRAHAALEASVVFLNRTLVTFDEATRLRAWGRT